MGNDLWLLANTSFDIPSHWSEWLGTIRTGELEHANVFLLSKVRSRFTEVLNEENQHLLQLVSNFYVGLLLASRFASAYRPVLLTGSRCNAEINLRQRQDFERPLPCIFRGYPEVLPSEFKLAARLAEAITSIPQAEIHGGHWRLFRALHVYIDARTKPDLLERLHQFCRCIEGLIAAEPGRTKANFKNRTELFVGPCHHDLMGEIYDVRSDVEHLHEDRYLLNFDRNKRLGLVKMEAVIEYIARRVLETIIGNPGLWPHFANRDAIKSFWSLSSDDRERLWRQPFDPEVPLSTFDPQWINDSQLGQL
jgi:hypothetical protein